jgi:hypothetical protein
MVDLFEGMQTDGNVVEACKRAAEELKELNDEIAAVEEQLTELKSRRHYIRTKAMPQYLMEAGLEEIKVDGMRFVLNDFVVGSIPKDPEKRARAMDELEAMGAMGLLKTNVSVAFGKGDHELAEKAFALLNEHYGLGSANMVESVHPSTLQAHVRDMIRNGEAADWEALGIQVGKKVDIR